MVRTICPSPPMRIKALGVNAAAAAPIEGPVLKPMRSPPPSAALALRNCRRERSTVMSGPFPGRVLDSLADSHISAAAADVPRHGGVDIAVGRVGVGREQRRRGHDLAGLAIAALRHLQRDPGLLDLLAGGLVPMASIVVTRLPAAAETGVMHERAGLPSTCTVHAPHSAMPQPNFVPVIPSTSRITQSNGVSSSTSTLRDLPLIVRDCVMCRSSKGFLLLG